MFKPYLSYRSWYRFGLATLLLTMGPSLPSDAQGIPSASPSSMPSLMPNSMPNALPSSMPTADPTPQPLDSQSKAEDWSNNYRLGPGDVIQISVFGAEEYSGEAIVLQDGAISLPRAGRVSVTGQTFQQASATIASTYATYIRNPRITVTPIKLRPIRVAISGEVSRPGSYAIEPTQNNQEQSFPTLTQMIAQAGGITAQANLKAVEIRRPTGENQRQVTTINLWQLVQSSDLSQDVVLQSGDEIHIPTAADLSPQELTELASANFAPSAIRIYIAGEVVRPGLVEVPLNTPLNQALLAAGGFNDRADRQSVNLVRLNPNGTVMQQNISIDFNEGISETDNPILMNQDVVVVKRSGISGFNQVASTLLGPLGQILSTILGFRNLFP